MVNENTFSCYAEFVMLVYLIHNFCMPIMLEVWLKPLLIRYLVLCFVHTGIGGFLMYVVPSCVFRQTSFGLLVLGGCIALVGWQLLWLLMESIRHYVMRIVCLCILPIYSSLLAYWVHMFLHWYNQL